jgi:hypothetical protein
MKGRVFPYALYLRTLPFQPCTRVAGRPPFVFVTVDETGKYSATSVESLRYSTMRYASAIGVSFILCTT